MCIKAISQNRIDLIMDFYFNCSGEIFCVDLCSLLILGNGKYIRMKYNRAKPWPAHADLEFGNGLLASFSSAVLLRSFPLALIKSNI